MKKLLPILLLIVILAFPAEAEARGGTARMKHRLGFNVGLVNDPAPNIWGIAARYNLSSWFQLWAGYGSANFGGSSADVSVTSNSYTIGAGGRFFVPKWPLSPFVGVAYTLFSISGTLSIPGLGSIDLSGLGSLGLISVSFGLDWQTGFGFHIGAGAHYFLGQDLLNSLTGYGITPEFYVGWFF